MVVVKSKRLTITDITKTSEVFWHLHNELRLNDNINENWYSEDLRWGILLWVYAEVQLTSTNVK